MSAQIDQNDPGADNATRRLGSMQKLILFNNIRMRLLDQLNFLDIKIDSHSSLLNDLCDFYRHRGNMELERSRSLNKVVQCFQVNDTSSKGGTQWPFHTAYECWHHLISETQNLSNDYATLAELYNIDVMFQLEKVLEIYKKYQDLVSEAHDEILRILRNFYTTIHTYSAYQNRYKNSGSKQKSKNESKQKIHDEDRLKETQGSRTQASIEKQNETTEKLEASRARKIYKHFTETSNAGLHKCMLKDLYDLLYSMDTGFDLMVSKAILAHGSTEQREYYSRLHCFEIPLDTVSNTEIRIARKNMFQRQTSKSDNQLSEQPNDVDIQNIFHMEFELQLQILRLKEDHLRKKLEKFYKTLDVVEVNTADQLKSVLYHHTEEKPKNALQKAVPVKHKDGGKLHILANISPIAKQMSFKSIPIQKARIESRAKLASVHDLIYVSTPFASHLSRRPKLFGGCLEEYLKVTSEQIPLIMQSCIRAINMFGMHSQGIFRVSGSQVEILNFRDSFERGEDPLANASDSSDMNSVAGVLKLYLRELREPLFPMKYFEIFLSLIKMDSTFEIVAGMRNFLKNLSKPVLIVIRFLFSFLNHLSEHANDNMMDAFNLAISFGPTLMPAPDDKKQVHHQTQLNELIKFLIIYHKEVFPKDLGGLQYDKCIAHHLSENNEICNKKEERDHEPHADDNHGQTKN